MLAALQSALTPALRHHEAADADFLARPDVAPWIRDAWRWALTQTGAASPDASPSPDLPECLHASFDAAIEAFGPAVTALEAEVGRTREALRYWVDVAVERYALITAQQEAIDSLQGGQ